MNSTFSLEGLFSGLFGGGAAPAAPAQPDPTQQWFGHWKTFSPSELEWAPETEQFWDTLTGRAQEQKAAKERSYAGNDTSVAAIASEKMKTASYPTGQPYTPGDFDAGVPVPHEAHDPKDFVYTPADFEAGIEPIEKRVAVDARRPLAQALKDANAYSLGSPDFSNGGRDRYNTKIPASIRHNNPGATYPAAWMKDYGMTGVDIIGGGHKIAHFPDAVSGAAANIHLMEKGYTGRSLSDFIFKWSGGNSPKEYVNFVAKALDLKPSSVITPDIIRNDGWKILKAQSLWESGGKAFSLNDTQWLKAQNTYRSKLGLGPL